MTLYQADQQIFDRYWATERKDGRLVYRQISRNQRYYRTLMKWLNTVDSNKPCTLEIGCGTAIDSYYLAEIAEVEPFGVDLSEEALRHARSLQRFFRCPVTLIQGNAERLGFADCTFDLVFSSGVLEHFRDPAQVMLEQRRVLKRNGVLVIHVPQKYNLYALYANLKIKRGTWPWGWERQYSADNMRKLAEQFGFELVEVVGCNSALLELLRWINTKDLATEPKCYHAPLPGLRGLIDKGIGWCENLLHGLPTYDRISRFVSMMIIGVYRKPSQ